MKDGTKKHEPTKKLKRFLSQESIEIRSPTKNTKTFCLETIKFTGKLDMGEKLHLKLPKIKSS